MNVIILTDSQTRGIYPETGIYAAFHKEGGGFAESSDPKNLISYEVPHDFDVIQIVLGGWTLQEGWTPRVQEIVYSQCQERGWEPHEIDAVFIMGGLNDLRGNLLKDRTDEESYQLRNELVKSIELLGERIEMRLSYRARKIFMGTGKIWGSSSLYRTEIDPECLTSRFLDFTLFNYEICQRSIVWSLENRNLEYRNVFQYSGDGDIGDEIGHPNLNGRRKIAREIEELLLMISS